MKICIYLLFLEILSFNLVYGSDYFVILTSDSPIVRGATVHLVAELYDEDGETPSGSFKYEWSDNAIQKHTVIHESTLPTDKWSITYPVSDSPPGPYAIQVTVYKAYLFIYIPITSQRTTVKLTENLNGNIQLDQNNKSIEHFVSNKDSVLHKVLLNTSDADFLNKSATSVYTYWFIDCVYYGFTDNYQFTLNYPDVGKKHNVEALVVADFSPITTPAPPTTPAPNITVAPNTTISTTTVKPLKTMELESNITVNNKFGKSISTEMNLPYVCLHNDANNTNPPDPSKTYGYFAKKFVVKAPVTNISITGNYWVNKGDVLHLMVKCQGSPQFYYCKHIFVGMYNVTGNETCDVPTPDTSDRCEFLIERYLQKPQKYTIAIVIYNDVGKVVWPVTVTVYEVTKQAQISVIVVPVASSLVAVVLIVFGVAYYVQNRRRFIVEVADFNFGQQCNDLEYKTFWERVHDSISNALFRAPTPHTSEPSLWPPGRKYGSLT